MNHPQASADKQRLSFWRRRGQYSWALLDWAHQPYFTLVTTFIFAPYFAMAFIGDAVRGQELWGYTQALAGALIALLSPVLGAAADRMGRRKPWIAALAVIFVLSNTMLWFAAPGALGLLLPVMAALVLASISAEFIIVFSNAMLPDLVSPERLGRLSGFGWGLGYVGGLISLVLIITAPGLKEAPGQLVGPMTAIWFALFCPAFFLFTPDRPRADKAVTQAVREGLAQLRQTLLQLRRHGNVMRFLIAHMIYSDGLSALFAFGGIYGAGLFGWEIFTLGLFGIILIIFAAIGAFAGGWADDQFGSRRTILVSGSGLIAAALLAISIQPGTILFGVAADPVIPGAPPFSSVPEQAYLLSGILMGIFGGPVQAASRTLLARLAPRHMSGEFFGLYAMSGKATAFLAPLLIGLITATLSSQRAGMAVVLLFLILGFWILMRVKEAGR